MRVSLFFLFLVGTLSSQEEITELPVQEIEPVAALDLKTLFADGPKNDPAKAPPTGYTINYNTISMVEYLRFASKICKVNFIYNEADLNFTVTVVSDEPATPSNVMATLLQVLRIHGLLLLEQDNNLVIHKSPNVKQIATLVTENGQSVNAPIVTRIFRIKNTKPESIAAIIQPMISDSALLEISSETRQLILTDVTANVDKVAALIENLDSPHTLLEIRNYAAKNNKPEFLIELAAQIMAPLAQGNPFILVPQVLVNEVFIVSTPDLVEKTMVLLASLDTVPTVQAPLVKKVKAENVFVYKAIHRPGDDILKGLSNIAKNIQASTTAADPDLIQTMDTAKWIRETNSIMFIGTPEAIDKTREFLSALDVPSSSGSFQEKSSFFIYKPQYRNAEDVQKSILEMADNLKGTKGADSSLIETIESVKINPLTHTLSFSGEEKNFDRIRQLLATIDASSGKISPPSIPPSTQFYIYKPAHKTGEDLSNELKEILAQLKADKLADPALLNALGTMKWVKSTNSLLFTGDPASLQKIQSMVESFDMGGSKPAEKTFFQYRPKYADQEKTENYLKQVAQNLSKKKGTESLVDTLTSYKWISDSRTFMFYGSDADLNQVKNLLSAFDVSDIAIAKPVEKTFYQYHPKYAGEEKTENYLKNLSENFSREKGTESLVEMIKSYRWIPDSRTFMFYGSSADWNQLNGLLANFDNPESSPKAEAKPGYFIYKVQHTTGDLIEEDLDSLAKNFKSSGLKDAKILDVIAKMRYVKQTNSLLLSGDPQAIEEVKQLITQYDYPRTTSTTSSSSNFYMYKPQSLPAAQIQKSLKDVGTNLKNAGLADPNLLKTIDTMKYVDATNSLIFTGPPDALQKIQGLVKEIDIPPAVHAPIQHVGKTTFLLYKLKNASGPQIVTSLKNMTAELKKSGTTDKDFLAALNSIKFVKETNSLFFTGTEDSLNKIQALVEKFDVTSLGTKPEAPLPTASGPTNFYVYKVQSVAGPDLQKLIAEFAENLASSGLNDPDLFSTIRSSRWTETTQTLVFTGTPKSLDQVKALLKDFDIPSNLPSGPGLSGPNEQSIQAIDNTSFLVYKLQFHKGDEIQGALRQIAKDLIISNAPVNQGLLNSINSIQWLEVTNSLLCSGDQETLTRLRELIKNLDIPLKQVYIEMLVIQTNLTNALQFGLEWGANYKYRNKFGAGTYNSQPITGSSGTPDLFMQNLSQFNPASSTPAPAPNPVGNIPVSSGFDLGIIGEVIKHNGQTFLTLGSFLTALQTDDETTIIMTPKIITQDGRTSSIFVGENIPFVGSFVQNNGQNVVNTSNLEYRDIGFSLTVTPVLGNSDIVTLDINLDRSQTVGDVTGSINLNSGSANGITTSKTTMQTTVHVPDNNFLILSGMVNNTNVKAKAGIPCLGGLPLVGAAFSKNNDTIVGSNIVIFIRPHIINSVEDMRKITTKEEDFFRDQAGTPFLERNYDEAMELIKTIDDE